MYDLVFLKEKKIQIRVTFITNYLSCTTLTMRILELRMNNEFKQKPKIPLMLKNLIFPYTNACLKIINTTQRVTNCQNESFTTVFTAVKKSNWNPLGGYLISSITSVKEYVHLVTIHKYFNSFTTNLVYLHVYSYILFLV